MAHVLMLRAAQPVVTVHRRGIVVGCDRLPAGEAGDQHLGAAAESAVGIAEQCPIRTTRSASTRRRLHWMRLPTGVLAEIPQVGGVAVVIDQTPRVELIDDFPCRDTSKTLPAYSGDAARRRTAMSCSPAGNRRPAVIEHGLDRDTAVRPWDAAPPLTRSGNPITTFLSGPAIVLRGGVSSGFFRAFSSAPRNRREARSV